MSKAYTANDKYFYLAKQEWYRARSAFKLLEIQNKFKIIKSWQKILDLGASPGSWLQVCKRLSWDNSTIIWIDLKEIKKVKWVLTYQWDIFSDVIYDIIERNNIQKFDLIISDIAPNTSWIPDVDQYRSVELNLKVLEVMKAHLAKWWWAVFKLFKWEDFNDFWAPAKEFFSTIKTFKPKTSRSRSVEIFCVARL